MMKSYLRYEPDRSVGVITSVHSNVAYDWSGNLLLTGSGESVAVWNVRQGTQISSLTNETQGYPYSLPGEVNYIAYSPDKTTIAAGYSTGEICIFQYIKSDSKKAVLRGHQSAISCLSYNSTGTLLASGSRDSDIVIWDAVSCTGQCRLRGHKDAITGVAFISRDGMVSESAVRDLVVSVSKDTLLKVWDMSTQHCIQTIVGHRSEIWSLAVTLNNSNEMEEESSGTSKGKYIVPSVVTGAADDLIRAYSIQPQGALLGDAEDVLRYSGCFKLASGEKCTHIQFNSSGSILAALSGQKFVEVFRFRSFQEAKSKLKRRLKRIREKKSRLIIEAEGSVENSNFGQTDSEGQNTQDDAVDESIILSDCLEHLSTIRCSHKIKSFSIRF